MVSALVEVVLIVFGILVALGLQGWWENRVERHDLRNYLVALEQEAEYNDAEIDRYLVEYGELLARIDKVFALLADTSRDGLPEDFQQMLGELYWIRRPNLTLNAYDDMVNSGSLRLVDNRDLRQSIAVYVDLTAWVDAIEQETWKNYYTHQFPFLVQHAVISDFASEAEYTRQSNTPSDRWLTDTPKSPHTADWDAFRSREFWNLLYGWKIAQLDQGLGVVRARDQLAKTLPLLRAEIERFDHR